MALLGGLMICVYFKSDLLGRGNMKTVQYVSAEKGRLLGKENGTCLGYFPISFFLFLILGSPVLLK